MSADNAVRDPVHGWIQYNKLERQLIDSPFFQRLRWITQLGVTSQSFPGGVHTRFIHSLGVMKLSGKFMEHLYNNIKTKDNRLVQFSIADTARGIQLARIAGLLHDIGHGPFSHSYDAAVYTKIYDKDVNSHYPDGGHDLHRLKMIRHPSLANPLKEAGITPEDIISIWTAKPGDGLNYIIKTIMGGPLGADRMDFVLRDSYYTGTRHLGTIAVKRIMTSSYLLHTKKSDNNTTEWYLVFKEKCFHDIIQALDGRKFMYNDVYFHKTALACAIIIEDMLKACEKDLNLVENTRNLDKFMDVTEHTLIGSIMLWDDTHPAKVLCKSYMRRKLPKFIVDMTFSVTEDWNEKDWLEVHPEHQGLRFIRTRPFTGLDPKKFDQYNIRFERKHSFPDHGVCIETCSEVLERSPNSAIHPYYIVRGYDCTLLP
jgi:HD superfamily phosphohydrolase